MTSVLALIAFMLVSDGVCYIVTQSTLFEPMRDLLNRVHPKVGGLVRCPLCFGFWTGVLLALIGLPLPGLPPSWPLWLSAWATGAAASGWCFSAYIARDKMLSLA